VAQINHDCLPAGQSGLTSDPDKSRHGRVQHVAFEYETLDDLLGTYARLKGEGILPVMAVDEGLQTALVGWRSPGPIGARPDSVCVRLGLAGWGGKTRTPESVREPCI
jgi:hypothetical protein